ncbi:MAG: hypothetical protein J7L54_03225 [Elusimicrobia bacterium]|nr:hypothetical protein [Elusimicrobiota bacterium]
MISEIAFISPIGKIAEIFLSQLTRRQRIKFHIFRGYSGRGKTKKFIVLDCGTGTSAGDCVLFLKKAGIREITFFGFAGSVGSEPIPGEICTGAGWAGGENFSRFIKNPLKTLKQTNRIKKLTPAAGFGKANVYTTPSIFAEPQIFAALKERCFDIIDMETAYVAEAGKKLKLRFFYYITDSMLNFIKVNSEKIENLCRQLAR